MPKSLYGKDVASKQWRSQPRLCGDPTSPHPSAGMGDEQHPPPRWPSASGSHLRALQNGWPTWPTQHPIQGPLAISHSSFSLMLTQAC